ncbi:hypothetical protein DFH08DRAFT_821164 [Mycena albidolilacea]|uniref:Uncharacterized protein n=1 Tax=Mycena albidolilacea TaxID=1033008 RepID=A0AAD7EEI3_9AGAR|nr:hypothetical protein DFH08DRAFT_821164 [Mycena albidolilacea]
MGVTPDPTQIQNLDFICHSHKSQPNTAPPGNGGQLNYFPFGCVVADKFHLDAIQLLVHRFTYTNQYWSPPIEEFGNYSYAVFACDCGRSSLAIDLVGVGLSSQLTNTSDIQYTTNNVVLSQLAHHLKTVPILLWIQPFKKVIAIGHSAGSAMLTYGTIGSVTTLVSEYSGPIVKVAGSEDQGFCAAENCVDVVVLNAGECFFGSFFSIGMSVWLFTCHQMGENCDLNFPHQFSHPAHNDGASDADFNHRLVFQAKTTDCTGHTEKDGDNPEPAAFMWRVL